MKKLFLITCLLAFVTIATAQNTQQAVRYAGQLQVQGEWISAWVQLDFEQKIVWVAITEEATPKPYPFLQIQHLCFYDHLAQVLRKFRVLNTEGGQHSLYEQIFEGEISLVRSYRHNPTTASHQNCIDYFVVDENAKCFAINKLKQNWHTLFRENAGLLLQLSNSKGYDYHNPKHLLSMLRYHSQCKAKQMALNK